MLRRLMDRCVSFALVGALLVSVVQAAEPLPFRVPDGFEATLYADDALATDITALAIDPRGRIVVAGPSYIKILIDADADGRAESAKLFSDDPLLRPAGIAYFINKHGEFGLACVRDQALTILYDGDQNDAADPNSELVCNLLAGEFGVHGMCQGSDGALYIACGGAAGLPELRTSLANASPIRSVTGGGILKVSIPRILGEIDLPGKPELQIVADGFCNPSDIAFTAAGNLLTVDVDNEPDLGLPWYSPTRLFDVAIGRQHGWMLSKGRSGWNRPAYDPETVERAGELGTGIPSGLVVYRHRQFPERFRGGAFSGCWDYGRVDYLALTPDGVTLRAKREPFLEVLGESGLAPIDLAVGPEGDLFVACGGRGTRGAVIRIRHKAGHAALPPRKEAEPTIESVLRADQPDEAWSRRKWISDAFIVGKNALLDVIADPKFAVAEQVRAVEILEEMFLSLPEETTTAGLHLKRPELSSRLAWALGRGPVGKFQGDTLAELTFDPDPRVRLAAWTVWRFRSEWLTRFFSPKPPNWLAADDPQLEPRIRAVIMQGAAASPEPPVNPAPDEVVQYGALRKLKTPKALAAIVADFNAAKTKQEKLRALRDVQSFGGDIVVGSPYLLARSSEWHVIAPAEAHAAVVDSLLSAFPSGDADVDRELSRLLIGLYVDSPGFLTNVVAKWTAESDPVDDLHYLIISANYLRPRPIDYSAQTADALLALDAKLAARNITVGPAWKRIINGVFASLIKRDERLKFRLLGRRTFGRAAHEVFLQELPPDLRKLAAEKLFAKLEKDETTRWTPELIDAVMASGSPHAAEFLRKLWPDPGLQAKIFPILVETYSPEDRPKFIECLTNPRPEIVERAARTLQRGAANASDAELAAAVRGLRQMCTLPSARSARRALAEMIGLRAGTVFDVSEPTWEEIKKDVRVLRDAYQKIFLWYSLENNRQAAAARAPAGVAVGPWRAKLLKTNWEEGNIERGRKQFEVRQCNRCHMGGSRLGPDLDGVTKRYSYTDLFATIFEPSRFVPPQYRPTSIELTNGRTHIGIPAYESAGVVLLQTGADSTLRILGSDIAARHESTQSIMPLGLLNDFSPSDFADLHAYLASIPPKPAAAK